MNQIAAKLQSSFKQIINESEILNLNQELKNHLKNKCWKSRSKLKIAAPFKQINPFHCFAPSPHFNRVVQMVQLMRVAACKFWDFIVCDDDRDEESVWLFVVYVWKTYISWILFFDSWQSLSWCLNTLLVLKIEVHLLCSLLWWRRPSLVLKDTFICCEKLQGAVLIHVLTWMSSRIYRRSGWHYWCGLLRCVFSYQNLQLLFHKPCKWMPFFLFHLFL